MCCMHLSRRAFLGVSAGVMAGAALASTSSADPSLWAADLWDAGRPFRPTGKSLRVQPILMYRAAERREQASYKSWGGVQSHKAAAEEASRIDAELAGLAARAGFPVEVLPVIKVTAPEQAVQVHAGGADATIVYASTGSGDLLQACIPERGGLIFVRHRSGPVYYWYEALSVKYLAPDRQTQPSAETPRLSVDDVVVDDLDELRWRLRALYGMRNFLGARIVALGGPQGKYAADAPTVAKERYRFDIVDVRYEDFEPRLAQALADGRRMALAERWTDAYLALPGTRLATDRAFVVNAFVLYGLFRELMEEHNAPAFTIRGCMGTILPMARTTACLTLSLLNDEGWLAFCESDFVVIPPGILLHYLTDQPVFMHNSTFPHGGVVTCAHCTGPRRMNGERYEPVELTTHYESEYGAAPKVEIPVGQVVTFINPEYSSPRWLGILGTVESNPSYEICRSQQDVRIHGHWKKLLREVRDSHWMMAYGNHLREAGYASGRLGIAWENVSES